MRARFLPIISFLCLAPLLLLSCTASVNENPQDSIDKIESEVYDSSSWDENSPISTEDSTGCLVFQSPSNPSEIELYFVLSIDLGGIEYSRTLQAEQTIIIKNVPLGHHTVTCKAYKSETGSLFARGSADAIFKYGQTAEMSLSLKRQLSPEAPVITVQPESKVLSLGEDGTCSTTIRAEAKTSGGALNAVWYVSLNADMSGKEELTSDTQTNPSEADPNLKICTTSFNFSTSQAGVRYYQCEFTHTDGENFGDEVSVTKTNIVSIRVKALSSFTASYKGSPLAANANPSLTDFTITETYSDGSTATGDPEKYTIESTAEGSTYNKIGQLPFKITRTGSSLTYDTTVSYKYAPPTSYTAIIQGDSSITIAQYAGSKTLTVQGETPTSYTIYGSSPTQTVSDTVSYQWYKGTTPISGATDQRYTISADTAGTNSYSCKVTYTPNPTYALSTTATTKETPSVSVKVAPWTVSAELDGSTISPTEGRYILDSGKKYTFYLQNTDRTTLTSYITVAGSLTIQESEYSYLTINPNGLSNEFYVTPSASTSQNTSIEIKHYQTTLCTVQISIKPESTPSNVITSWDDLKTAINTHGNNQTEETFTIAGNLEADSYIEVTGNVSIVAADSSGATIYRVSGKNNAFFSVNGSKASLTLGKTGQSITLDGKTQGGSQPTASNPLISVTSGGTVYINNAVTLQNNKNSSKAGGAISLTNSTLWMSGGSIKDNTCSSTSNGNGGGGVYLNNSSMTFSGGTISGNTATKDGGGIYATNNSSITMSGNATISGNTSNSNIANTNDNGGGGIYLNNSSLNMISNAKIIGNTTNARGGGIYNTVSGNVIIWSVEAVPDPDDPDPDMHNKAYGYGNGSTGNGNRIYGYYKVGENGTEQDTLD